MNTNTNMIAIILEDIKGIEDNKKEIAAKYNIQSNKAAEIEKALLLKANSIRQESGELTRDAFRVFNSLWNVPESSQKLRKAMETETDDFIEAYMDYIRPEVERRNKWSRSDNRLNILSKILLERRNSKDDKRNNLIESLQKETQDFKNQYIDNIVRFETYRFNEFAKYKDMNCWIGYNNKDVVISASYKGEIPEGISKRWVVAFNTMKTYSNKFDFDFFKERVEKDAEREYNNNIEVVADRIIRAGMDTTSIKVNYIGTDPKAFEMYLTDGEKKMHCRSIFCAEYSVLVEAHWRFIITNA